MGSPLSGSPSQAQIHRICPPLFTRNTAAQAFTPAVCALCKKERQQGNAAFVTSTKKNSFFSKSIGEVKGLPVSKASYHFGTGSDAPETMVLCGPCNSNLTPPSVVCVPPLVFLLLLCLFSQKGAAAGVNLLPDGGEVLVKVLLKQERLDEKCLSPFFPCFSATLCTQWCSVEGLFFSPVMASLSKFSFGGWHCPLPPSLLSSRSLQSGGQPGNIVFTRPTWSSTGSTKELCDLLTLVCGLQDKGDRLYAYNALSLEIIQLARTADPLPLCHPGYSPPPFNPVGLFFFLSPVLFFASCKNHPHAATAEGADPPLRALLTRVSELALMRMQGQEKPFLVRRSIARALQDLADGKVPFLCCSSCCHCCEGAQPLLLVERRAWLSGQVLGPGPGSWLPEICCC